MAAAGGARVDCVAEMPFEDYVYHLTQVHGVTRFELSDAEGFYDFKYGARGDDFCGLPNIICNLFHASHLDSNHIMDSVYFHFCSGVDNPSSASRGNQNLPSPFPTTGKYFQRLDIRHVF